MQNLIPAGMLAPHLEHVRPPVIGGGATAASGSLSPQELQNFCPAGFSFPQPVQIAIVPPSIADSIRRRYGGDACGNGPSRSP